MDERASPGVLAGDRPPLFGGWYGYQTLALDGLAALLIPIGQAKADADRNYGAANGIWLASGLTYLLGAPIVHWAHGKTGRGFGSLGLRLGVPVAGFFAGAMVGCDGRSGTCFLRHGGNGFLLV